MKPRNWVGRKLTIKSVVYGEFVKFVEFVELGRCSKAILCATFLLEFTTPPATSFGQQIRFYIAGKYQVAGVSNHNIAGAQPAGISFVSAQKIFLNFYPSKIIGFERC